MIETRELAEQGKLELRAAEGDTPARLTGYAAVYNTISENLGGFRERLLPGVFKTALAGADIRCLVNHDDTKLLGRTPTTLRLFDDPLGLRFEVDVAPTTYGNDLLASVQRGDCRSCSFGFVVPPGGERFKSEGKEIIRELTDVKLYEISIVLSLPAYPGTSVAVRVDPTIAQRIASAAAKPEFANRATRLRTMILNERLGRAAAVARAVRKAPGVARGPV